jgi:hypothetical protein
MLGGDRIMVRWKNQEPVGRARSHAFHGGHVARVAEAFRIHGAIFAHVFYASLHHVAIGIAALSTGASGWSGAHRTQCSGAQSCSVAHFAIGCAAPASTSIQVFGVLRCELANALGPCEVAHEACTVTRFGAAHSIGTERRSAIGTRAAKFPIRALGGAFRAAAIDVRFVAILHPVVALEAHILMTEATIALRIFDAFDALARAIAYFGRLARCSRGSHGTGAEFVRFIRAAITLVDDAIATPVGR